MVVVTDIIDSKLELAKKAGATDVINCQTENLSEKIYQLTENNGIGKILECSGVPKMLTTSIKFLRKGGQIGLIGLPKTDLIFENPIHDFVFKSLTIKTVHGRRIFHTWEECERLILEGKCQPEIVVSHDFELDRYEEAFQTLFSGEACKIVIKVAKTSENNE